METPEKARKTVAGGLDGGEHHHHQEAQQCTDDELCDQCEQERPGEVDVDESNLKAWGWFDTAWGPGIAAYDKLVEAGFDVDVEYIESGMCFAGHYNNGEDYCIEYSNLFEEENWRDQIDDDAVLAVLECEYESWLQWQQEEENQ